MRRCLLLGLLSILSLTLGIPAQAGPESPTNSEPVRSYPLRRATAATRMLLLSQFLQLSFENHYIATGEVEADIHSIGYTVKPFHWPAGQDGMALVARPWELKPSSPGTYISPLVEERFHFVIIDSNGSQQLSNDLTFDSPRQALDGGALSREKTSLEGFPRDETPTHELIRYSTDPSDRAVDQWRTEALLILTEHYRQTGALPMHWDEALDFLRIASVGYSPVFAAMGKDLAMAHGRGRHGVMIETDVARGLVRVSMWLKDRELAEVEQYKIAPATEATSDIAADLAHAVTLGQAYPSDLDGAEFSPLIYAGIY